MRTASQAQQNYIIGLRSRVPGDHSARKKPGQMNKAEAMAEIALLQTLEKKDNRGSDKSKTGNE